MHRYLDELLNKRKVKIEELAPEEKDQFDRWEKVLSEGEMSVERIEAFCRNQVSIITRKMRELDNSIHKNERLVILLSVYDSFLEAIKAPQVERENLEKYLISLIDK